MTRLAPTVRAPSMRLRSESLTGPRGVGHRKTRSRPQQCSAAPLAGARMRTTDDRLRTLANQQPPMCENLRGAANTSIAETSVFRSRALGPVEKAARSGWTLGRAIGGLLPDVDDPLKAAIEVGVVATASGAAVAPVNGEAVSPDGPRLATTSTDRPRGRGTPCRGVPVRNVRQTQEASISNVVRGRHRWAAAGPGCGRMTGRGPARPMDLDELVEHWTLRPRRSATRSRGGTRIGRDRGGAAPGPRLGDPPTVHGGGGLPVARGQTGPTGQLRRSAETGAHCRSRRRRPRPGSGPCRGWSAPRRSPSRAAGT